MDIDRATSNQSNTSRYLIIFEHVEDSRWICLLSFKSYNFHLRSGFLNCMLSRLASGHDG